MPISRYQGTKILKDDKNISYRETFEFPNVDFSAIPHVSVSFSHGDRLDILAHKFYGQGQYWWIIAWANNLAWPFSIPEGTILTIPLDHNILLELFK